MHTDFDIRQFYMAVYDGAAKSLDSMERLLFGLVLGCEERHQFDALFRNAKTLNAGAVAFGSHDLAAQAQKMDSVLDRFRCPEIALNGSSVAALRQCLAELRVSVLLHRTAFDVETPPPIHDLSQFKEKYLNEASEALDAMHDLLSEVGSGAPDISRIDACLALCGLTESAATTFGFADLTELARETGTLLRKLRRSELGPVTDAIDVPLVACGAMKVRLGHRRCGEAENAGLAELLDAVLRLVRRLSASGSPVAENAAPEVRLSPPGQKSAPAFAGETRKVVLTVGPLVHAELAEGILELFRDVPELGTIEASDIDKRSAVLRRFRFVTRSPDSELLALFGFYVPQSLMRIDLDDCGATAIPAVAPVTAVNSETCPVCGSTIFADSDCANGHAPICFLASERSYITASTPIARLLSSKGFRVSLAEGGIYSIRAAVG